MGQPSSKDEMTVRHSLIAAYAPCTLTTEYFLHTGREDMWSH